MDEKSATFITEKGRMRAQKELMRQYMGIAITL